LSSSTGNPGSNGQRAAAVQRLKAAVAERKRVRELREASKRTNGAEEQAADGSPDSNASPVSVKNRSGT
jgi:hypothetical protein